MSRVHTRGRSPWHSDGRTPSQRLAWRARTWGRGFDRVCIAVAGLAIVPFAVPLILRLSDWLETGAFLARCGSF